jgi:hypothetical protein
MCIHCLGHFSPLPSPPFSPPHFQAEPLLPSSLILLREDKSNNKKDIVLLLVEIRIAIQRDSQHCFHAHVLQPKLVHLYQIFTYFKRNSSRENRLDS